MDWEDCNFYKFAKKTKIDRGLINSLISSSNNKSKSAETLKLNKITSSSKFSLFYESLREILEAIALTKGFKIYNHECFVSFLREICNEEEFSKSFDRLRSLRNKVNYYGESLSVDFSKDLIKEIKILRASLIKKYLK